MQQSAFTAFTRATVAKLRTRLRLKQPVVRVTLEVTPINGADLKEVSDLVRDLLAESCGDANSDSFKDVRLINAVLE